MRLAKKDYVMRTIENENFVDEFLALTDAQLTAMYVEIQAITKPIIRKPISDTLFDNDGIITRNAMALIGVCLMVNLGYNAIHKEALQVAFYEHSKLKRQALFERTQHLQIEERRGGKYGHSIDLQATNKLISQKGYNIAHAGDRIILDNEIVDIPMRSGLYVLSSKEDLGREHSEFYALKRARLYLGLNTDAAFRQKKNDRDNRCWCCGSREEQINVRTGQLTGTLQRGHMISALPLRPDNIIPLCAYCNGAFRDDFDFAPNGAAIPKKVFDLAQELQALDDYENNLVVAKIGMME